MILSGVAITAGESVGLIANLEENIKGPYSFKTELSPQAVERCQRALDSAGAFIGVYEPKLDSKFSQIKTASYALFNTVNIMYTDYIRPFKKKLEQNIFDTVVDRKTVSDMEKVLQQLKEQLKKIKGSLLSGISLFKKSEAQKVFNAARDIMVNRIEEVMKEFERFKKNPIIN